MCTRRRARLRGSICCTRVPVMVDKTRPNNNYYYYRYFFLRFVRPREIKNDGGGGWGGRGSFRRSRGKEIADLTTTLRRDVCFSEPSEIYRSQPFLIAEVVTRLSFLSIVFSPPLAPRRNIRVTYIYIYI